jgi:nucleoid-associated protein YgaU
VEGTVLPAAPAAAATSATAATPAATAATPAATAATPAATPAAKAAKAAKAAAEASVEAAEAEASVAEAAAEATTERLCLVSYYKGSCCKQCYYCCNSYNTYSYRFCICYHMYFLRLESKNKNIVNHYLRK